MYSMAINQTKPWYRFPLVWMLIAIPLSAVVMGVILLWLAVDTNDGLVVDDYYKEGLAINQVIERDDAATHFNIAADLKYDNATRAMEVTFTKGLLDVYPATIQLHIKHATRAKKDHHVILRRGITNPVSGQYFGILSKPLTNGYWYFEISNNEITYNGVNKINRDNWRLTKRFKVTRKFDFTIKPLPKKKIAGSP